jgi:hypothetical protein
MKTHTDPVDLGNLSAQILFLQALTGCVAIAIGRSPADLAAQLSQTVSERIEALTMANAEDCEQLRAAAHTLLAKIIGGVA